MQFHLCLHSNCSSRFNLKISSGSAKKTAGQPKSIDDFMPEDTIDSAFLGETEKGGDKKTTASSENDSSDDSDR